MDANDKSSVQNHKIKHNKNNKCKIISSIKPIASNSNKNNTTQQPLLVNKSERNNNLLRKFIKEKDKLHQANDKTRKTIKNYHDYISNQMSRIYSRATLKHNHNTKMNIVKIFLLQCCTNNQYQNKIISSQAYIPVQRNTI